MKTYSEHYAEALRARGLDEQAWHVEQGLDVGAKHYDEFYEAHPESWEVAAERAAKRTARLRWIDSFRNKDGWVKTEGGAERRALYEAAHK